MKTLSKDYDESKTSDETESQVSSLAMPNLKGDWMNFYLLILLYTMQGMSYGLTWAFPIIFQSRKDVTYKDQAAFSVVQWPISIKLLWAPIVDALYVQWIGKRKSWLIPIQYSMGACLLYMASNIENWLPESGKPNFTMIICIMSIINFLSATQDIVVDGWALTMLKKNNVSYSSTCNGTGVALGLLIGSICPTLLTSEQFSNRFLRNTPGIGGVITFQSFLYIWGILCLLITTLISIFKKEKDSRLENNHVKNSVIQHYKLLWDVLYLPSIRILAIILLTAKFGFSATDSVTNLKLIDAGVSKDDIMIMATSMCIIKIILPLIVTKYTSGPKPMSFYLKLTPLRLLWGIPFAVLIYYTPAIIKHKGVVNVPIYYYMLLGFTSVVYEVLTFLMLITLFAFFSRISDPRIGGIYMTLLNTLQVLGRVLINTITLKMIDVLTFKKCSNDDQNSCSTLDLKNACTTNGGSCTVIVDGYYIQVALCVVVGFVWFFFFRKTLKKLQSISSSHWLVDLD